MGFVNSTEKKAGIIPEGVMGWIVTGLFVCFCTSTIYLVFRLATGKDPLEGLARKAQVLVGLADDKKKMVTE